MTHPSQALDAKLDPQMVSKPSTAHLPRLIRACHFETLDRPPVWLMRQAGRYMAEYQAMRQKYSFLELCKNVDAAVEVSLQPLHAFGMDACIMFSDILVPVEAMGMDLVFTDQKGPQFPTPLRSARQVDALRIPNPQEATGFVAEILKTLRAELGTPRWDGTALIGFAGAPWTLASYMIEGGTSKQFTHIKTWMCDDPQLLHRLLQKVTHVVIDYLKMQVHAGAQAVQLFDSWAGAVTVEQYREFIQPYQQQIIQALQKETTTDGISTPVILYVNGSRGLLPLMSQTKPTVVSVDWLTSLTEARRLIDPAIALQGNLDPSVLFASPEYVKSQVNTMAYVGGNQGYIFNLGHGILPGTPVDRVKLLVDTVKSLGH